MAMKKSKAKKKAPKKMPPIPKPPSGDPKCNVPYLCNFVKDLSDWLQLFIADYAKLRIAVCNVEKQVWSGTGVNAKPPKFCTGGPVTEPAPPPPPPVW